MSYDTYENNNFVFIKNTLDLTGLGWKDLDLNLSKQLDGDIKADLDIKAIENSLENIMNTFQGSRRMLPDFALPLYNLLFEQMDTTTAQNIGTYILHGIATWENRIILKDIKVTINYTENRYDITLSYVFKNRTDDDLATFTTSLSKL